MEKAPYWHSPGSCQWLPHIYIPWVTLLTGIKEEQILLSTRIQNSQLDTTFRFIHPLLNPSSYIMPLFGHRHARTDTPTRRTTYNRFFRKDRDRSAGGYSTHSLLVNNDNVFIALFFQRPLFPTLILRGKVVDTRSASSDTWWGPFTLTSITLWLPLLITVGTWKWNTRSNNDEDQTGFGHTLHASPYNRHYPKEEVVITPTSPATTMQQQCLFYIRTMILWSRLVFIISASLRCIMPYINLALYTQKILCNTQGTYQYSAY